MGFNMYCFFKTNDRFFNFSFHIICQSQIKVYFRNFWIYFASNFKIFNSNFIFLSARFDDPARLNKKIEFGNSGIKEFKFSINNSNFSSL